LYLTTGVASGLRSGANIVITPFSWAVNTIAHPLGHMLAGTIDYSDVVAQNQKLRYELGQANERANEGWAFARQLQQLTTDLERALRRIAANGRGASDDDVTDEFLRHGQHFEGPR
jgi:cell shape-determining protein MreC